MVPDVISVQSDVDVMLARQRGRELAAHLDLSSSDLTLLATAISEITRNIVQYAQRGELEFRNVQRNGQRGLMIIARDQGPGIPNLELAMQDGYSTSQGMGLGLPGAKRLMDEFDIRSEPGSGTTVTMVMWEHNDDSVAVLST